MIINCGILDVAVEIVILIVIFQENDNMNLIHLIV